MNARELLGIIDETQFILGGMKGTTWMLGLEALDEDTLKFVLWHEFGGRRLENSQIIAGVSSVNDPVELADGFVYKMASAIRAVAGV